MKHNQNARIISTYSADTFGVCSALFELGGMIVMHDPSGCNSTYTTHDEPRWYDFDSLIFISALTEQDAVLGRDDKFIHDVVESACQLQPKFICIIPSQITFLIGTDMRAVAKIIERETHITCFTLPTNSMHYYARGIYYALEWLAAWLIKTQRPARLDSQSNKLRVNILGVTPLDFATNSAVKSLREYICASEMELLSCWAIGETLNSLGASLTADVNLVVSYGGLGAARVLERELGIPYVIGVPIGTMQEAISTAIVAAAQDKQPRAPYMSDAPLELVPTDMYAGTQDNPRHAEYTAASKYSTSIIIGESISAQSLAIALERATGNPMQVIAPVESEESILRADTLQLTDEKDIEPRLAHASLIIADPMYRPIAPATATFVSLPHEGFSGRLYARDIPDLINPQIFTSFLERITHAI